jgi:hypothetical protein
MNHDKDIAKLSFAERGKELRRIRKLIRTHKHKKDNARCWLNDKKLYDQVLPEGSNGGGRMTLPFETLIGNCRRYIRRQQCDIKCPKKTVCGRSK